MAAHRVRIESAAELSKEKRVLFSPTKLNIQDVDFAMKSIVISAPFFTMIIISFTGVLENLQAVSRRRSPILTIFRNRGTFIGREQSLSVEENLGINCDPSHFVWQQIDYVKPLYEFKDKIFHVHFKDIKVYKDKLNQYRIMAYPLDYMSPKLPGLGDVNWANFVSALTDIRYDGFACLEIEDKAFEGSIDAKYKSLILSRDYILQWVI